MCFLMLLPFMTWLHLGQGSSKCLSIFLFAFCCYWKSDFCWSHRSFMARCPTCWPVPESQRGLGNSFSLNFASLLCARLCSIVYSISCFFFYSLHSLLPSTSCTVPACF